MYKNRTKILNICILVKIFVYISKAELLYSINFIALGGHENG